jgi:hypothetical protein
MASEFADPPAPQAALENKGGAAQTRPAFIGPYVDQALTTRNPPATTIPDVPVKSGSTTLGEITVYDPPGVDHTPGGQGATTPPHSPNSWRPGRDPYKVDGMPGQDFLKNAGS